MFVISHIPLITGAPVFVEYPVPLWLTPGSEDSLTCEAEGNPSPIITWKLNGSAIADSGIEIGNETLTITSANSNNTGVFTCVATNSAGVTEVSVLVELSNVTDITGQDEDTGELLLAWLLLLLLLLLFLVFPSYCKTVVLIA